MLVNITGPSHEKEKPQGAVKLTLGFKRFYRAED